MNPFNPDSLQDAVVLIVLGALAMLTAVIPAYIATHKQSSNIDDIKEQVVNSHNTNLRDDIDKVYNAVRKNNLEIHESILELRKELRAERQDRIEGDKLRKAERDK